MIIKSAGLIACLVCCVWFLLLDECVHPLLIGFDVEVLTFLKVYGVYVLAAVAMQLLFLLLMRESWVLTFLVWPLVCVAIIYFVTPELNYLVAVVAWVVAKIGANGSNCSDDVREFCRVVSLSDGFINRVVVFFVASFVLLVGLSRFK